MKINNIKEAEEYVRNNFKKGDLITCCYTNKPDNDHFYEFDPSSIRIIESFARTYLVCNDLGEKTAYIVLWNSNTEEVSTLKNLPFITQRPRMEELKDELTKYANIGNILGAVKHYKEHETVLDIQLRQLKKQQQNE